ncbi:hypothetical protein [Salibaculum griseiflavum]|uniref:Uncharacterized protein n=1 Tax=Salibaculum griseiflavum TaxID=1914409 RepID=A0A2V1P2H6_9RHOB|nr:hypothetical protein [Salibaculum griseiflavum]PWG15597.1 hypothetical protein DFK10_16055 [Salibaculum griseiflavum]
MSKVTLNNITVDLTHPLRRSIIELSNVVEAAAKRQSDLVWDHGLLNDFVCKIAVELLELVTQEKSYLEATLMRGYLNNTNTADLAFELISQIRPDAYDPVIRRVFGGSE